MSKRVVVIGGGNMGTAIVAGMVKSGTYLQNQITIIEASHERHDFLKGEFKETAVVADLNEPVKAADIIILAVKPNVFSELLPTIAEFIHPETVIVSVAAGLQIKTIAKLLGDDYKIVRTMPNLPAAVSEGMTVLAPNTLVNATDLAHVKAIFDGCGKTEVLDEKHFDAVTALSGSSPAMIFMFIEAMADGAVLKGIPRRQAYNIAAQAVLGSVKFFAESGKHPGELKDMVCSPGGTTIEMVSTLEATGFRSSILQAISDCADKSASMK
jgi:pyrroline-5-carboxylate reductase